MDGCLPSWNDAVRRLKELRRDDLAFVTNAKPNDQKPVRATVADLYVRYIVISNELTVCHDYIIQYQIRVLIQQMLMCINGRILELKQILIDEDQSIYTPVTGELANLELDYDQCELRIPRCFRDERREFLDDLDGQIDGIMHGSRMENEDPSQILKEDGEVDSDRAPAASQTSSNDTLGSNLNAATFAHDQQPQTTPPNLPKINHGDVQRESAAIAFIRDHVGAADDRMAVNELLSAKRTRANIISGKYKYPGPERARGAAIKIQRYWRMYQIMRWTRARVQRTKFVIGMHVSNDKPNTDGLRDAEDTIRAKQTEAAAEYRKTVENLQYKFDRNNRCAIREDIENELRWYIWEYFKICKHLPPWPDSKPIIFKEDDLFGFPPINLSDAILKKLNIPTKHYGSALKQRQPLGGSAIFHTGRYLTIEQATILAPTITAYENKPAKEKRKINKEFADRQKKEKDNKIQMEKLKTEKLEKSRGIGYYTPEPSDLTELFNEILYEYDSDWTIYDELDLQPRKELITADIFAKAQVEIRAEVDETMKEEMIRIRKAQAQRLGKKYEPPKKKKIKKKVAKKSTITQKSPEMIFKELVINGMIKKSVVTKFDEFKGAVSYSASALREEPHNLDPACGLGDIRQIIKELYVVGMNYAGLRKMNRIKFRSSLLIAGPAKSGKTMLTNAIRTETGSLKIQLTIENVSTNYPNAKLVTQLVKDIVKLVKSYAPVVIEVDLADVPFYRKTKIPVELKQFKPKLMEQCMVKLLKSLTTKDRAIVVGKATSPWLSVGTKLSKLFDTVVFTVPDYNTIFTLLHESLMHYRTVKRTFPVTPLANILADYPRQAVVDIVAAVMNNERVYTLRYKPLEPEEFIPVMCRYAKISPKEPTLIDKYYNWYRKFVPLGIKRIQKMNQLQEIKKNLKKNLKKK